MAGRSITIIHGLGGEHLLVLDNTAVTACRVNPDDDLSWWDVMRVVKKHLLIPRKQQRLILDDVFLAPLSKVPDGDVIIKLVQLSPGDVKCLHCGRPQPDCVKKFRLCSGCLNVQYCTSKCQRKHWTEHKVQCKSGSQRTGLGLTGTSLVR